MTEALSSLTLTGGKDCSAFLDQLVTADVYHCVTGKCKSASGGLGNVFSLLCVPCVCSPKSHCGTDSSPHSSANTSSNSSSNASSHSSHHLCVACVRVRVLLSGPAKNRSSLTVGKNTSALSLRLQLTQMQHLSSEFGLGRPVVRTANVSNTHSLPISLCLPSLSRLPLQCPPRASGSLPLLAGAFCGPLYPPCVRASA